MATRARKIAVARPLLLLVSHTHTHTHARARAVERLAFRSQHISRPREGEPTGCRCRRPTPAPYIPMPTPAAPAAGRSRPRSELARGTTHTHASTCIPIRLPRAGPLFPSPPNVTDVAPNKYCVHTPNLLSSTARRGDQRRANRPRQAAAKEHACAACSGTRRPNGLGAPSVSRHNIMDQDVRPQSFLSEGLITCPPPHNSFCLCPRRACRAEGAARVVHARTCKAPCCATYGTWQESPVRVRRCQGATAARQAKSVCGPCAAAGWRVAQD